MTGNEMFKMVKEECEKILGNVNKPDIEQKSDETARYWVDPSFGFKLDLNKLDKAIEKKECLEVAKLLPANDRLEYLRGCGVID